MAVTIVWQCGCGFRVSGLGSRVSGLGLRVKGLGFGGLGLKGFRGLRAHGRRYPLSSQHGLGFGLEFRFRV